MEMNSNGNDFERFLREKADEFSMFPSKRVWYSIYNNMHPGNRLPSVSMCIVLLAVLFFTGYLNTRPVQDNADRGISNTLLSMPVQSGKAILADNKQAVPSAPASLFSGRRKTAGDAVSTGALQRALTAPVAGPVSRRPLSLAGVAVTMEPADNDVAILAGDVPVLILPQPSSAHVRQQETASGSAEGLTDVQTETSSPTEVVTTGTAAILLQTDQNNTSTGNQATMTAAVTANPKPKVAKEEHAAATGNNLVESLATVEESSSQPVNAVASPELNDTERSWIEHYAWYNRRAPRKWAGKVAWQAYITPAVVYRTLHNNAAGKSLSGNGMTNFNSANLNHLVRHKPSVGLEAGLSLQYDLLKTLKLKGGFQFNFTRYNALAYENHHPISTSITINGNEAASAYEIFRSTNYSNIVGLNEVKLHNQTVQFSLPVGLDFRLLKAGNISWYAGATLQPSLVLFGQTYLISSDRRNYVKDASMLNRINLNAGFETYLSIDMKDYSWQIGPQYRTQMFSTNNKIYSVEERLMSFGIKAGITRKF